jgi:hypothetical protein
MVGSLSHRTGRADLDLDPLGHLLADGHVVGLFHMVDDRLVEIVARRPHALADADVRQGDDRHLGGPAADVDDHAGGRFRDRQARADGRRHGLFNQEGPPRAGTLGALQHGALFNRGDPRRNGDDYARPDKMLTAVYPANEITQHGLGDFEVADDPILQRPDGRDRTGGLAEHFLGNQADGVAVLQHAVGPLLDGNNTRLVKYDPLALYAHQGVAGSEVDPHINAEHSQERIENHAGDSSANGPLDLMRQGQMNPRARTNRFWRRR